MNIPTSPLGNADYGAGVPFDIGHDNNPYGADGNAGARQAKFGLYVLLGVMTSLFLLFILSFILRAQYADWRSLTAPLQPLADPWQLWINTGLLIGSSAALQWARVAARRQQSHAMQQGLLLGGSFAIAFLAGQLWVWQQLFAQGYGVAGNPANSFFYLLTGIHGVHLLGGLVAWSRTMRKTRRDVKPEKLSTSVELCAIYWHFLLAVWLVLLVFLTSTPATFTAIATFCGF